MRHCRYLSFDIEIARSFPSDSDDWKEFRPFGISCAATWNGEGEPHTWYGMEKEGSIAMQMSRTEAASLVTYLQDCVRQGYTIVTWNGLGFDFDVLAEESGMLAECKELALNHIDMMFHFFCLKGFGLALDKAAKGLNLPGKTAGMDGSLAPKYWQEGRKEEILAYVSQDARTTYDLACKVDERRQIRWVSRRGDLQVLHIKEGWLTAQEALKLPEPDTSRMRDPWKRSKFTGWTQQCPDLPEIPPAQGSLFDL